MRKLLSAAFVGVLLFSFPSFGAPLPKVFLDRVVAIGRKDTTPGPNFGKWVGEATGFIYGEMLRKIDEENSEYQLFLVTNRHVLEGHTKATNGPLSVRLNPKSGGTVQQYDIPLTVDGKPTWRAHPDPSIDLVLVSLNGQYLLQLGVKFDYFRSNSELLTRARAKELDLTEGYGVFVLGFPMGLVGTDHDYVIVREGSIARVRDTIDAPEKVKSFLIDSFVFPGNSGGPVVLRPESPFSQFKGEKPPINTAYLLGIVRDYIPYVDIAISPQTQRPRVSFEENSGLTDVIPADYIEEVAQGWIKEGHTGAKP